MIYIDKGNIPPFWEEYVHIHPKQQYKDLAETDEGSKFRRRIREHNTSLQRGLCCYCCKRISVNNASNEHIKPQSHYPKETLNYHNILSSCNTLATCTSRKGSKYDEKLFVSPIDSSCENEFVFTPTGEISALSARGRYTIDLLNLNSKELRNARRAIYSICCQYSDAGLDVRTVLIPDSDGKYRTCYDAALYYCSHVFTGPERQGQN